MDKALYQALKDIISTNIGIHHLNVEEYNRRYRAIETIKEAVKPYDEITKSIINVMGDYQYKRDFIKDKFTREYRPYLPATVFDLVFDYLLETGKIKPVQWVNDPTVTGYEVVK